MPTDTNDSSIGAHYVVTASKPTSVKHSLVCAFISPNELNLVLSKVNRLEVHRLCEEGLQGVIDIPIYGRISQVLSWRVNSESTDRLFVLTEKYRFCVVQYDREKSKVVTIANGDVSERVGRECENGLKAIIDPQFRVIGMMLYDGLFKIIPLNQDGSLGEALNLRLEKLRIIDICFLEQSNDHYGPTLAIIYEDSKEGCHLKTYELQYQRDAWAFADGGFGQQFIDPGATVLFSIPQPLGGMVVVGDSAITYYDGKSNTQKKHALSQRMVKAYGRIDDDGSRVLLGDMFGWLHLLVLLHDGQKVSELKMQKLGRAAVARTINYLDNGVVYVGSHSGDSKLIRLTEQPVDPAVPDSFVQVLDRHLNLAPIVDFCAVDLDKQGQDQIVTCSGLFWDGSLGVIRNGIGIRDQATVELPGIRGLWNLKSTSMDIHDQFLVLTFVGETRVLAINQCDELDEVEIEGFDSDSTTLCCGNAAGDHLVQVTQKEVRCVDAHSKQLSGLWQSNSTINVVGVHCSQILLSIGQGILVYLEINEDGKVQEVKRTTVSQEKGQGEEIACVDIAGEKQLEIKSKLAAIATWTLQVILYSLPDFNIIHQQQLSGELIPRSILFCSFEGADYMLLGMGDGHLHNWRVDKVSDQPQLTAHKKICLGNKPIQLWTFKSKDMTYVFAASDRPTVIYSNSQQKKLLYSNLNENDVNFLCSFDVREFPDCLAVAKEGCLMIGQIDEIQKLHIRTYPLNEQPRRIAHQAATNTFGVLCIQFGGVRNSQNGGQYPSEQQSVRILDDQTFADIGRFNLIPNEDGCSITSVKFNDESVDVDDPSAMDDGDFTGGASSSRVATSEVYYAVGTTLNKQEETESTKGRVLILRVDRNAEDFNKRVTQVFATETHGAVYNVLSFLGKLLCSVNNQLVLYRWSDSDNGKQELVLECSHHVQIVTPYLATRQHFVLAGDMMRSLTLCIYDSASKKFVDRARDYNSNWMTSCQMVDDDVYLGSDNCYNLFAVSKSNTLDDITNKESSGDSSKQRMVYMGQFHLGDFVNRIRHGCIVMRLPDALWSKIPSLLYVTVGGALGAIFGLPQSVSPTLLQLQEAMRNTLQSVGDLNHEEWRAFKNEVRTMDSEGFIDGDLIEQLLDLPNDDIDKIMEEFQSLSENETVTTEDVMKLVEELARLH